ncbi:MAG: hypothetical protein ACP5M9_01225 [Candidatus Micrarchaeia archaeon]
MEWKSKNLAIKTKSIRTLHRLYRKGSDIVRLAVVMNPITEKDIDFLVMIAKRDKDIQIRDRAIEHLLKIKRIL